MVEDSKEGMNKCLSEVCKYKQLNEILKNIQVKKVEFNKEMESLQRKPKQK